MVFGTKKPQILGTWTLWASFFAEGLLNLEPSTACTSLNSEDHGVAIIRNIDAVIMFMVSFTITAWTSKVSIRTAFIST